MNEADSSRQHSHKNTIYQTGHKLEDRPSAMSRIFGSTWVKLLVAVAVVALLVYFNRLDASMLPALFDNWPWLLASFLLMLPPFVIISLRLRLILESMGIFASVRQTLRWTMIGAFFDLSMPSSSGGDVVKAGYLVNYADSGQGTHAVMAVAFDRLLGLLGLFLLVSLAGGLGWNLLSALPGRSLIVSSTLAASLGTLIFLRIAGSRRLIRHPTFDRIMSRPLFRGRIKQFVESFNALRECPKRFFFALGFAVLGHIFVCFSLLCLTRALGNEVIPIEGFLVFPLALFGNIFGVAGGFGIGTAGFDMILSQLLGIRNGALIGLLFQTMTAIIRLGGIPFYLTSPPSKKTDGW